MCDASLKIGDRVYYTDNGADDTGTVDLIDTGLNIKYGVTWDDGMSGDVYLRSQLTRI